MAINISSDTEQQLLRKIVSGGYDSVEHVIQAGLASLDQAEHFGEFLPGEMNALIEQGEQSIQERGVIAAKDVFNTLKS